MPHRGRSPHQLADRDEIVNDPTIFTWPFVIGFAAFIGTLWLGVKFIQARDRARAAAKHRHPAGRGRCGMRSHGNPPCTRPGTEWVADQNMQAAKVCPAHLHEGIARGWWVTR